MDDLTLNPDDYLPIDSVPRDGQEVILMDPDVGAFIMLWDKNMTNALVPGVVGMWRDKENTVTWSEVDGSGPRYWKPHKVN